MVEAAVTLTCTGHHGNRTKRSMISLQGVLGWCFVTQKVLMEAQTDCSDILYNPAFVDAEQIMLEQPSSYNEASQRIAAALQCRLVCMAKVMR